MSVEMKWNKPINQIAKEATGGNRTLLFMANEARRLMNPYVPARNMVLARNVRTYVEGDVGIVHYLSPYARFQHEGNLMLSKTTGSAWARYGETKYATDKKLRYSNNKHPLATSHWEEAMMVARGEEYRAAVQRYVEGRG